MRGGRYLYAGALVVALVVGFCLWSPFGQVNANNPNVPRFVVDPFWPKPLPDGWVTGEVGGTCIDSHDHVFIVTRGFQTGGLTSPEGVAGAPKSVASPPAIEFD